MLALWAPSGAFIVYGTLIPFDFSAPPDRVNEESRVFFARSFAGAWRTDL